VDQKTSSHTAATADPTARTTTTCARCGTTHQGLPLTWTCSVENGRRAYLCDHCAREHLRAIESRLDPAWW
jgi:transposase